MKPEVSIVMPVLNGERYIAEAIDSVLAQTYTDYELVLVDDGSTDRTREIVESYTARLRVRYVTHPVRQGISRSVNDGVRSSSGRYITFLDHDDAWMPEMLAVQVGHLAKHPEAGMVHADFQTIDSNGAILEESVARCRNRKRPSGRVFRELFFDSFIVAVGAVIRKECFDRFGGFDETLHWGDYHLWLRIAREYEIHYTPRVLAKYRQHSTQSTRTQTAERPDRESVAMLAIKRLLEMHPEIRNELGDAAVNRRMAMLYFDMAYTWMHGGAPGNARACLKRAIRLWPTKLQYSLWYAASLFPLERARAINGGLRRFKALFSVPG